MASIRTIKDGFPIEDVGTGESPVFEPDETDILTKGIAMFRQFSKNLTCKAAPAPDVDFNGLWKNELGSEMSLTVTGQRVSGTFKTAVGEPGKGEEFPLLGFASGDLISFCVNFGAYGSLAAWSGQHTEEQDTETIHTLWHLARNIEEEKEPEALWSAIWTGANTWTKRKGPASHADREG